MLRKFWLKKSADKPKVGRDSAFHVAAGDALNREKRWTSAIEHYKQALDLDPTLTSVWIQLGHGYRELGDFDSAETAYRRALSQHPQNDDAWFFLGVTLRAMKRTIEAFAAYSAAYKLNPRKQTASDLASCIGVAASDVNDFLAAIEKYFDPDQYLEFNVDVQSAGIDPVSHYATFGWKENRLFSLWFDASYYRTKYKRELRKLPPLLHYFRFGERLGFRTSLTGGESWFEPIAPAEVEWAKLTPARIEPASRAVVILPVFKGYDETLAAVYHAVRSRGKSAYGLLVINDSGPDLALNAELEKLAGLGLFDYIVNESNLGFVRTCNRAILELSSDKDVVLLNSDAYVPAGWFDRLIAHADADRSVATVTPLSNNATICSYPVSDQDNRLSLELTPQQLDELAAEVNQGVHVETPTGVGFCFFMSRRVIDDIGALDAVAFKVGYGEENDFCMRALEAGYINVIAADVFVFHVGSVSFSATKETNFASGQKALALKHPNYTLLTHRHVKANPLRTARIRLDMARLLRACRSPVVFITHSWGGGIQTYLQTKQQALERQGIPYITIRVHDRSLLTIETADSPYVPVPNLANLDLRLEADLFERILSGLEPSLIHINSFAGLDWTHHKALLKIIMESGIPYRFIGHDYSAVSRYYHLTRPDGIYRGQPSWAEIDNWLSMTEFGPEDITSSADRRSVYEAFLKRAEAVEFPTDAARDVFSSFYPEITAEVAPHVEPFETTVRAKRRPYDGRLRIATIGSIGLHKGSDVVLALSRDALARDLPIDYFIVGHSDQDGAMRDAGVTVTGHYDTEQEAIDRLVEIEPDLILFASIWPETYCYTLSIALAIKLPFAVFDLGAQAQRGAGVDWCVHLNTSFINAPNKLSEQLMQIDIGELWSQVD